MSSLHSSPLILASSSKYRQALLKRLGLPFQAIAANIDETPMEKETPTALALRLSQYKARKVASLHPQAIVIGSDQVCTYNGNILGKAGTVENACAQLQAFSGQRVTFLTGITVLDGRDGQEYTAVERYDVVFRHLSTQEIARYIQIENPLDTAGSFYMEGRGIALFEKMQGDDPNTLIGLPLIRLCEFLRRIDMDPLANPNSQDN